MEVTRWPVSSLRDGLLVCADIRPESLLEAQTRPRPRRQAFRMRVTEPRSVSRSTTPAHLGRSQAESGASSPQEGQKSDIMMHGMLAPSLSIIGSDDILSPNSSSLTVTPATNGYSNVQSGKRGPRGRANDKDLDVGAAPGTSQALAIASGQAPAPTTTSGKRGAGAQSGWVLGKALNEMKKMEEASLLERDSDWARIQGSQGRGRRGRGD